MKRISMSLAAIGATATLVVAGASLAYAASGASTTSAACPTGNVCAYTGKNETGTKYTIPIKANEPAGTCHNVSPAGVVIASADNETAKIVDFRNGTCADHNPGEPKDKVSPKVKEDLPDAVDACL
jgi:hypothetical protein